MYICVETVCFILIWHNQNDFQEINFKESKIPYGIAYRIHVQIM